MASAVSCDSLSSQPLIRLLRSTFSHLGEKGTRAQPSTNSCLLHPTAQLISLPAWLRGSSGVTILGALSISRELSLTGPVGPDIRRPPTSVGSRDRKLQRSRRLRIFSPSPKRLAGSGAV